MDDAELIRDLEYSMGAFPLSLGGRCEHCDRIHREAAERWLDENARRVFAEEMLASMMGRVRARGDGEA